MTLEKNEFYIKIYHGTITKTGKVDCGCEITEVKPPTAIIKCCPTHSEEIKTGMKEFPHVSPSIENPDVEWEVQHLAAVAEKILYD